MATVIKWKPLSFLASNTTDLFSLIILNQPILIKKEVMAHLWNNAKYRLTVDGGTNHWFEWLKEAGISHKLVNSGFPDLVTGDFDSIKKSTLDMLHENSVRVENTPNQDRTDFCKAIDSIKEKNVQTNFIVTICEVSGRLDHILSQLNTLHSSDEKIVLLSSCNAIWLLKPGSHEIDVLALKRNVTLSHDAWIGLIPLGAPSKVTTSGLKWNLENQEMKFGGLISSSNTYSNEPIIKIETDEPLIWSMGVSL